MAATVGSTGRRDRSRTPDDALAALPRRAARRRSTPPTSSASRPTQPASAHADGSRRLGFPADAYVLALVGGTGVGKSSLLNALAGATVSQASARRPTTERAGGVGPGAEREALDPLLEWLGVAEVREHGADGARARSRSSTCRTWTRSPPATGSASRRCCRASMPSPGSPTSEKYHDAVLHDDFLRTWVPRLDRQAVIVNKADRLGPRRPTAHPPRPGARPRRSV